MYLDYFSIERHPFRITPDTSLFFAGGDQGRGVVLDAMLFAIETGEGILKVVGEVGSGKTMLCRMLEERLPDSTEVVYLANPKLDADDILYAIAFDLKLLVRRDTSKLLVMQQLQNYLLQQHANNRKVLVIIEEAQGMALETLEEIRLFSNLETSRDKLMQIILFGQPELDKVLANPAIRQLRERITHSFYLHPLGANETADYIRFRLGAAGCPCPELFAPAAERAIARASLGLTRRVNILADKALLAGYADNALSRRRGPHAPRKGVIRKKHVVAAIRDSEYLASPMYRRINPWRILGTTSLAAIVAIMFTFWPISVGKASQLDLDRHLISPLTEFFQARVDRLSNKQSQAIVSIPSQPQSAPVQAPVTAAIANAEEVVIEAELAAEAEARQVVSTNSVGELPAPEPEVEKQVSPGMSTVKLVRERALASIDWLARANRAGYTVQFVSGGIDTLNYAATFLGIMQREELLDDAYVCMSVVDGRAYWSINYGSYTGVSNANEFLEGLPPLLQSYEPLVQNMNVVECNSNSALAAAHGG